MIDWQKILFDYYSELSDAIKASENSEHFMQINPQYAYTLGLGAAQQMLMQVIAKYTKT